MSHTTRRGRTRSLRVPVPCHHGEDATAGARGGPPAAHLPAAGLRRRGRQR